MSEYPLPHPARGYLAARRITFRAVADAMDYSEHWVSRVLNGYERPSKEFRRRLSELLDEPASELFHADLSEPGDPYPGNRTIATVLPAPEHDGAGD